MDGKYAVAAVLVLLVLVGGVFLLIGLLNGDDSTDGSNPGQSAPAITVLQQGR